MKLLIAPHNDDENLFASFTLQREKPLVVICTDSWIQYNRGDMITAKERQEESLAAARVIGYPIAFLGIKDTELNEWTLTQKLGIFRPDIVYAPAVQGGNPQHDLVGMVAKKIFPTVIQYTTYSKQELWTTGDTEVVPTPQELEIKNLALGCYTSQLNLPATRPHFAAVVGKSEWLIQNS